ncbi:MAG TPA: exopolysaccharide biosynthesis polyprenyl glycosylphosphotransferase [Solirubrobacteraceae bacterium]|nr:exopolysaccharide biosynthesis polyprenyl glycosylphosphotransferase [Solirubrobacteraceae bacterium]
MTVFARWTGTQAARRPAWTHAQAWRWLAPRRDVLLGPLCGAITLALLALPADRVRLGLLAFCALAAGAALARRVAAQAALLPLMRHVYRFMGPFVGLGALAIVELLTGTPAAGPLDLLAALAVTGLVAEPWAGLFGVPAPGGARAAYIGSAAAAERLARALEAAGSPRYVLVGHVAVPGDARAAGTLRLGELGELVEIVVEHDVDLLVMGSEAPRLDVFGEVTESCLGLPVRLVELSSLFEEVFGHVPTAEINACWFQCLAEPGTRGSVASLKRTVDVFGAVISLALVLPLLPILVVLIRRDGGPALFSQVRIGEGGRRFRLHKLRTMRVDADSSAQWACADDPRMTRVGAWLRRTHLDELPQLVNVLRGEMSLVGPRPEQPQFVDRLEQLLPFYQRRHLIRPGITGWAQIRCGYAGSDIGSAWKLCHDLYYAKHRSAGVDLLILCETLATLFFQREAVLRPENVAFVLADER